MSNRSVTSSTGYGAGWFRVEAPVSPDLTTFFKDEWKVTPNLTLNIAVQWEWYGLHYEQRGIAANIVNGYQGLCGIGCGALTQLQCRKEFAQSEKPVAQ